MSGDDHGRQIASPKPFTEAIENGEESDPRSEAPSINIASDSEETSTASRTVQEFKSPEAAAEFEARVGATPTSQPVGNVTSCGWEETSDSVPDDLPSVHVSHE